MILSECRKLFLFVSNQFLFLPAHVLEVSWADWVKLIAFLDDVDGFELDVLVQELDAELLVELVLETEDVVFHHSVLNYFRFEGFVGQRIFRELTLVLEFPFVFNR